MLTNKFFYIIFVVGTAFQILCAIYGFDLSDEGFVMTLYRDFLENTDAAKTGSGYPVSGIIGWGFSQIIPGNLLAMRMWGILLVSIHTIIIYFFLKDKFDRKLLSLGLFVMMLVMGNDPKPLGYNNITGLIATISIISIFEGTIRRKLFLLFFGGALIGLNTFVRLPNILGISFVAIPVITNCNTWRHPFTKIGFLHAICIFTGVIIGGAITWEVLTYTGVDRNVITFIQGITAQLNGDSSHSSSSMIERYLNNYSLAFYYTIIYVLTLFTISYLCNHNKVSYKFISVLIAFLFYRSIYFKCDVLGNQIFATLNGIGLFGAYILGRWGNRTERAIGLTAALMSIVLPAGSDQGFITMWNGTWLSFPIGLASTPIFLKKMKDTIDIKFSFKDKVGNLTKSYDIISDYNKTSIYITILAIVCATGYKVYHKCYYDPGDRFSKIVAIDSRYAKGIYTAKDKAERFNPLLAELRNYVSAGDTILEYDWSPMLFYLTNTKPYANISWPCLYYGKQYTIEIAKAEGNGEPLPVVVLQHYSSITEYQKEYLNPEYANDDSQKIMIECINNFVRRHKYKKVWSNKWFDILLPPGRERLSKPSNDW